MSKSVVVAAIAAACACAVSNTASAADYPHERAWQAARAAKTYSSDKYATNIEPDYVKTVTGTSSDSEQAVTPAPSKPVLTLDATPAPGSKIHGFLDLRVATGYLTPRGLQVQNAGVVVQPLAGLVFDLYSGSGGIDNISFIMGIWSSLHSDHPGGDLWNECDIFAGFDIKFLGKFNLAITAMMWTFPDVSTNNEGNPQTEYNLEVKLGFDDTEYLKEWALHPYVSVFWNFNGDSPVVLGQQTFYVELGITPSYTLKAIPDVPITFSFPMYFQVGDSSFWGTAPNGDRSNLGLFSAGVKISAPLTFIPKEYGSWNTYVGFTYIHICNEALVEASHIVGSGETHERFLGYCGVGMGF